MNETWRSIGPEDRPVPELEAWIRIEPKRLVKFLQDSDVLEADTWHVAELHVADRRYLRLKVYSRARGYTTVWVDRDWLETRVEAAGEVLWPGRASDYWAICLVERNEVLLELRWVQHGDS